VTAAFNLVLLIARRGYAGGGVADTAVDVWGLLKRR
jgi:hypothetical protein